MYIDFYRYMLKYIICMRTYIHIYIYTYICISTYICKHTYAYEYNPAPRVSAQVRQVGFDANREEAHVQDVRDAYAAVAPPLAEDGEGEDAASWSSAFAEVGRCRQPHLLPDVDPLMRHVGQDGFRPVAHVLSVALQARRVAIVEEFRGWVSRHAPEINILRDFRRPIQVCQVPRPERYDAHRHVRHSDECLQRLRRVHRRAQTRLLERGGLALELNQGERV